MNFEQQYISLREKEQRLYNDEQVMQLPLISTDHPHYEEWKMRRFSAEKLVNHLQKMNRSLRILEVGCGNGWLSNKLAEIPGAQVTGFDINSVELLQAQRVFHHQLNLQFVSEDPFLLTPIKPYDVIVFAASIQYFPSLKETIGNALQQLVKHGCIHIIDSHFYKAHQIAAAKQRSTQHYDSFGFPELSKHYFHHSLDELKGFNMRILYNPNAAWNKLKKMKSPFPWICIKKS